MGNQLIWHERFNIGVELIDKEHRKLFSIINKLFAFTNQELKSQWACQEVIKYFKDHALKHFTEEEAYMESIYYEGLETHKRIHNDFRKKILPALEKELEQTAYCTESINHFLGVCAGWLLGHTLTEDQAITRKGVISKWDELLSDEKQDALIQIIIQLLYELFQLEAKVISKSYGGERFGKAIYYRLVYGKNQDERLEIILAFEEKLLTGTVGKIIGDQSGKVDVMILNITRYMAKQFMNRVAKYFSDIDFFEVKKENLLTYNQFKNIFDENHMQCSLLFDTGEGYLAYCVIASHLLQDKIEKSIKTDNEMIEVRQYLKENKTSKKKKILVVDDSKMIRQTMKELLEQDYEVELAKSGISAIQCISLNRPDLILLDYNMPICNGKQVLEMIRSENDFSDIPVFFLTGRVDKESVMKIMPLNPEGYLLKTLKQVEIKNNIDNYFKKNKLL